MYWYKLTAETIEGEKMLDYIYSNVSLTREQLIRITTSWAENYARYEHGEWCINPASDKFEEVPYPDREWVVKKMRSNTREIASILKEQELYSEILNKQ